MGNVILPSGTTVWVQDLQGSLNLSQLIDEIKCDDYTVHYRVAAITAVGRLGKHAEMAAAPCLRELASRKATAVGNQALIVTAAEQALRKLGEDVKTTPPSRTFNSATTNQWAGHSNTTREKPPDVNKVTFTEVEDGGLGDGLKVYASCHFCGKMSYATQNQRKYVDGLAENKHYCTFCLRNDYHTRVGNNIMALTFRGVFGYYYYAYFTLPRQTSMLIIDINDIVHLHAAVGLQNPIFQYDPETFTWFVDFGKVGRGRRKMPVENVLETIIEMLACLNLYEHVRDCSPRAFYQKYRDAVVSFADTRARTKGAKVFAPTLWGCNIPTKCLAGQRAIPVDLLRNFMPYQLVDNYGNNRHRRNNHMAT